MSKQPAVIAISPKIRNRQSRTRQRILQESARLFIAKGFENVSVEEIIAASEVARSSFYRFFANREDLLAQIVRPVFERGLELLRTGPDGDGRALLDHLLQCYLTLWRENAEAMQVSTRVGGVYFALFDDVHNSYREALLQLLEKIAADGILLSADARIAGGLIARTAIRVLEIYSTQDNLEALFMASMRGLLVAPAQTPAN